MELRNFAFWIYNRWPKAVNEKTLAISALGLGGETAEVVEEVLELVKASGKVTETLKKNLRGSGPVDTEKLKLELGDVLHYWCVIANFYDLSVTDIMDANVNKLVQRELAKHTGGSHASA